MLRSVQQALDASEHYKSVVLAGNLTPQRLRGVGRPLSDCILVYGSFAAPLFRQLRQLLPLLKQMRGVVVWFDDFSAAKLQGKFRGSLPVLRRLGSKLILCTPRQSHVEPIRALGFDCRYVKWSAAQVEQYARRCEAPPAQGMRIWLDTDRRRISPAATVPHILDGIELFQARSGTQVHVQMPQPNAPIGSRPSLHIARGRLPYRRVLKFFATSDVYITNIHSSYEFPVLESQLLGNWVVEYGRDRLQDEHRHSDLHIRTCTTAEEVAAVLEEIQAKRSPELREQIKALAREHYSWRKAQDEMDSILRELCEQGKEATESENASNTLTAAVS